MWCEFHVVQSYAISNEILHKHKLGARVSTKKMSNMSKFLCFSGPWTPYIDIETMAKDIYRSARCRCRSNPCVYTISPSFASSCNVAANDACVYVSNQRATVHRFIVAASLNKNEKKKRRNHIEKLLWENDRATWAAAATYATLRLKHFYNANLITFTEYVKRYGCAQGEWYIRTALTHEIWQLRFTYLPSLRKIYCIINAET